MCVWAPGFIFSSGSEQFRMRSENRHAVHSGTSPRRGGHTNRRIPLAHPGQFVLGATLEDLRFPKKDLAADVVGRSSWGRVGLLVATAVMVQPGYRGTLTLEWRMMAMDLLRFTPDLESRNWLSGPSLMRQTSYMRASTSVRPVRRCHTLPRSVQRLTP